MSSYSISQDQKFIAFAVDDAGGRSSIWVAPTDRSSSPVRVSTTAVEDSPFFLPDGELVFRVLENGSNYCYRMNADGSNRRKAFPAAILDLVSVSPDGRWVVSAESATEKNGEQPVLAIGLEGNPNQVLCIGYCSLTWDVAGKSAFASGSLGPVGNFALSVSHDTELPQIPATGLTDSEALKNLKGAVFIPHRVESALNSTVYAFTEVSTHRNLYRIQLP